MVLAIRPWLLVPGLKSALIAALTTGRIATTSSTVWLLADSLSWRRLVVATSPPALIVGWLIIDGEPWDRPTDKSPSARDISRLYNASTLLTLTAGVLICCAALYLLNLLWAAFVLDHVDPLGSARRAVDLEWWLAGAECASARRSFVASD